MPNYHIYETSQFSKNLCLIAPQRSAQINEKLKSFVYPQLRKQPHFGPNIKKLRDYIPPTWRYRIGEWRFFYEIDEAQKEIWMTAAHHRKEAYR